MTTTTAAQAASRRGRKPIPEEDRKRGRIDFRVHHEKKASWQAKAKAAGFDNLTAWIESTLDRAS